MKGLDKIVCFFKRHKRGKTKYNSYKGLGYWKIECVRCKYTVTYDSPFARLVSTERDYGFDGE